MSFRLRINLRHQHVEGYRVEAVPPRRKKRQRGSDGWEQKLSELCKYKRRHGDCCVPKVYAPLPSLGYWVERVRRMKKGTLKNTMPPGFEAKLDEVGFDWNGRMIDSIWQTQFEQLLAYRRRHGDCRVPRYWKEDPKLARWVDAQRRKERDGTLPYDRMQKLSSVGFTFRVIFNRGGELSAINDRKWIEKFDRLKKFKEQHGHCIVPTLYEPDRELGCWAKEQRVAYSLDKLRPSREALLKEIGFELRPYGKKRTIHSYRRQN